MTANFSHDLRIAVRRERDAAFAVKTVGGFEETDIPDLSQVVHRLASIREPARDGLDESEVLCDEFVTAGVIALML